MERERQIERERETQEHIPEVHNLNHMRFSYSSGQLQEETDECNSWHLKLWVNNFAMLQYCRGENSSFMQAVNLWTCVVCVCVCVCVQYMHVCKCARREWERWTKRDVRTFHQEKVELRWRFVGGWVRSAPGHTAWSDQINAPCYMNMLFW